MIYHLTLKPVTVVLGDDIDLREINNHVQIHLVITLLQLKALKII